MVVVYVVLCASFSVRSLVIVVVRLMSVFCESKVIWVGVLLAICVAVCSSCAFIVLSSVMFLVRMFRLLFILWSLRLLIVSTLLV